MKRNRTELVLKDFQQEFNGKKFLSNSEIADFYNRAKNSLSNADLRRIVYGLKKEGILFSSGSGIYTLENIESKTNYTTKKTFKPNLSEKLNGIRTEFRQVFPFIESVLWESRVLHEFMNQQPRINLLVLECEKGTEEAVFDHFNSNQLAPVYLHPDRTMMERYVLTQNEALLVSKLTARSPKIGKDRNAAYAKIEKILIDLLVDNERFYIYQGLELVNIYNAAFTEFLINEDTLINYAKRRNAEERLRNFILTRTNLELRIFQNGDN